MTIRHFVAVQSLSCVRLFVAPWTAACQVSLSFTIYWSLHKLMSIVLVMPPSHLILCSLLLLLPSIFSNIRVFPMKWLFTSCDQSTGASASTSIFPINIQGLFPLWLTDLISLQSEGLSRVFSSTPVQKHQLFSVQPSLWLNPYICTWLLEKP